MNCQISLAQLSEITGCNSLDWMGKDPEKTINGITTDSRTLKAGEVFLALRGEKFDGHNFAQQAINRGATAIITEENILGEITAKIPQLQVKDTLVAYQDIAHWWRNQFTIPIIGVTGSVGKTTTKELITAVLATQGKVLKTEANYNNEIGVPKTLLGLSSHHDYGVIEMAMRARGEIALLTQIACPNIGVITNVGTAHIGRLGSQAAIAQAKCELLGNMPTTGVAILNHDNPLLLETAAQVWQGKTLTYGLMGGDIQGKLIDTQTLLVEGMKLPLPLLGEHNALNYLAALAVAKVLGIDWQALTQGVSVNLPQGRAQSYHLPGDIILLDETYNAGLESMVAALNLLAQTPGKRHLAVLGTMKELGSHSQLLHRRVGEEVKRLDLDAVLILADEPATEGIAVGATGIPSECFESHAEILAKLQAMIQPGDRILFKASHSVGLDRIVQKLRSQDC